MRIKRINALNFATSLWFPWLLHFLSTSFISSWVSSILETAAHLLRCRWLLYLLICLYVCVPQLVWAVSVFGQRRNTSWRCGTYWRSELHSVMFVFSLTRHGSWRTGKTGLRALTLDFYFSSSLSFIFLLLPFFWKPSVFVVPESKAKASQSRFFHSGPVEMEPATEWRHCRCSRPFLSVGVSLRCHSEWPPAPGCKRHLVVRHQLGWQWGFTCQHGVVCLQIPPLMMLKTFLFLFLKQLFFLSFFHLNTMFMLAQRHFHHHFSGFNGKAFTCSFPKFQPSFRRQIWNTTFRKQKHSAPQAPNQHDGVFGCDCTNQTPIKRPSWVKTSVFSCDCQSLAWKRKQEKGKNLLSDKLGNRHRVQKEAKNVLPPRQKK